MQITQDVRDDTETLNGKEQGIADMSKKFIDMLEEEAYARRVVIMVVFAACAPCGVAVRKRRRQ
jgi:hypothetical protein